MWLEYNTLDVFEQILRLKHSISFKTNFATLHWSCTKNTEKCMYINASFLLKLIQLQTVEKTKFT